MPTPSLHLQSVSKRYHLREPRLVHRASRALLASWTYERKRDFWALRDIDLDLRPGQTLGVIGVNGSGKSTLLKLMAGVSSPTEGSVDVQGRLVGLLELGAGFHPDLTGYQNIYLQCNLLGLTKAEIDQRLQQIMDFSGLGGALDWPVKRYSSGMYARLGFSVALHIGAQIMLIDEILAVGDADFQQRGLRLMRQIRDKGESIIVLVTHDIYMARTFCDELIWLDHGRIISRGESAKVATEYWEHVAPIMHAESGIISDLQIHERAIAKRSAKTPLRITHFEFRDEENRPVSELAPGQPITLAIALEADEAIPELAFDAFVTLRHEMVAAEINSDHLPQTYAIPKGRSELLLRLDPQLLLDETYHATVILYRDRTRAECLDAFLRQGEIRVISPQPWIWHPMQHPHVWKVEQATIKESPRLTDTSSSSAPGSGE